MWRLQLVETKLGLQIQTFNYPINQPTVTINIYVAESKTSNSVHLATHAMRLNDRQVVIQYLVGVENWARDGWIIALWWRNKGRQADRQMDRQREKRDTD